MSPLLIPIFSLYYILWEKCNRVSLPNSQFGKHMNLLYTPIMCFITDVLNYMILLFSLIVVCLRAKWDNQPTTEEFFLWICAFSRLTIEIRALFNRGFKNYFRNIWKYSDLIVCGLVLGSAVYRLHAWLGSGHDRSSHKTIKNTTYMYAFAEILLILRCLVFLELSKSVGYLLIALRNLIFDVMNFVVILGASIFGTAVAVFCITNNIDINGWDPQDMNTWDDGVPEDFKTFSDCVKNILWSTFGLLDVPVSFHLNFYHE